MPVSFNCDNCGKKAEKKPYLYKKDGNNFCNRNCYNEYREKKTKVELECNTCGKEFARPQSTVSQTNYCSQECLNKGKEKEHPVKTCQTCEDKFTVYPSQEKYKKNKYCSKKCYGKSKRKSRVEVECRYCGEELEKKENEYKISEHHYCDHKCLGQWQAENRVGEEHPAWAGGHPEFYGTNWKQKRTETLERDNYECQKCGATPADLDQDLDVHHIKPIRTFDKPENANYLTNLISVCRECHRMIEGKDAEQIAKVTN